MLEFCLCSLSYTNLVCCESVQEGSLELDCSCESEVLEHFCFLKSSLLAWHLVHLTEEISFPLPRKRDMDPPETHALHDNICAKTEPCRISALRPGARARSQPDRERQSPLWEMGHILKELHHLARMHQ